MLASDEVRVPLLNCRQERKGAEVTVVDPQLALGHRGDHLLEQRTLLGVPVLAGEHVPDQAPSGIQNHQALARQGPGSGRAQLLDAVLGGGDAIAVENPHRVALHQRRQGPAHLVDQRRHFRGHGANQRLRGAGLDVLELAIDGNHRHANLLLGSLVSVMDRLARARDHARHEVEHRREHQLVGVLVLAGLVEQGVQPCGAQEPSDRRRGHDRGGTTIDERIENLGQHAGLRAIDSRIRQQPCCR